MTQEVGDFTGVQVGTANELATTGAAAEKQYEIQGAIIIARKFPRSEQQCFMDLMKACSRPSFAENAKYSFPRGETDVTGPSITLAREAARVWGNLRYGLSVVRDDEESRLIRAWAWDIQTNVRIELEDDFQKLIQRKRKGETVWLVPDERDLRELTNRRGAILLRNALLQVLPKDLIEDALYQCEQSLQSSAKTDPEAVQKRLLVDFGNMNITVEQIEQKLGHAFAQSTPKELAELRGICKSIQDGHTTWAEYVKGPEKPTVDEAVKQQLADGQEKLKQQQEQPKQADPQGLTYAQIKAVLQNPESVKEVAEVMNGSLKLNLTSEQRNEITMLKDEAMKTLRKKK